MADGPTYRNPRPPEGINSRHRHPLADVAKMMVAVVLLVGGLSTAVYLTARLAAPLIPFAWEQALAGAMMEEPPAAQADTAAIQTYLEELAVRLSRAMALPDEMTVTVHYVDSDTVNAFATLGGHIYMHDGLLRLLDSENAVAMLLGHEIAHIKHRDPVRSAGAAALASLVTAALVGDADLLSHVFGFGDLVRAMYFSREQEAAADAAATRGLYELFGHLGGARDLYRELQTLRPDNAPHDTKLLASHPHLGARITLLEQRAAAARWPLHGELTKLPCAVRQQPGCR